MTGDFGYLPDKYDRLLEKEVDDAENEPTEEELAEWARALMEEKEEA